VRGWAVGAADDVAFSGSSCLPFIDKAHHDLLR
jgi:hypothetical protein